MKNGKEILAIYKKHLTELGVVPLTLVDHGECLTISTMISENERLVIQVHDDVTCTVFTHFVGTDLTEIYATDLCMRTAEEAFLKIYKYQVEGIA